MDIGSIVVNAGMSARPEYYSGYGITTDNLKSEQLIKIYDSIVKHYGKAQAKNFAIAVSKMPLMSATAFLTNLYKLAGNKFSLDGIAFGSNDMEAGYGEDAAFGFFAASLTESYKRDIRPKTEYEKKVEQAIKNDHVRGMFLRMHNLKAEDNEFLRPNIRYKNIQRFR